MPLKLLKRTSNHYNVVSKSTFVISVILLDNGIMECTLDAESTGKDCLNNITQRLALHQPEFFGLRYISRGVPPRQRWVELQHPLKKQLDKYSEDPRLSLGVMFYVGDVNLLKDEMTRYHYFLQLKADVIDGKLNCTIDQAISLAAYSLQAEFGDYDTERHTVDYLRDFAILPKDLISENCQEFNVDALFDAVARQYGSLLGFPPALAEIYYIMVSQQLDGYGQECYPTKDDSGNDVLMCVSGNGIIIRRRDWTHIVGFRWRDIKSLIGHKKTFLLDNAQLHSPMNFHFADSEVVKYIRKVCSLQSAFHKGNPSLELHPYDGESHQRQNDSRGWSTASSTTTSYDPPEQSYSNVNLMIPLDSNKPMGIGDLRLDNNNFPRQSITSYSYQNNSLPYIQYRHQVPNQQPQQIRRELNRSLQEITRPLIPIGTNLNVTFMPALSDGVYQSVDPNGVRPNCDAQPLLPSYRAAPDYDTAVQLKFARQQEHGAEEPIYQNEIMSKFQSIDLRERERDSSSRTQLPLHRALPVGIIGDQFQQDVHDAVEETQPASLSYMNKPPPPYPGSVDTKIGYEHVKMLSSNISNSGAAKPRSSFNAHAEVLKQISSDLYMRAAECSVARHPTAHPQESNKLPSYQMPKNTPIVRDVKSGPTNILGEVTKSVASHQGSRASSADKNENEGQKVIAKDVTTPESYFCKPIDPTIVKEFQSVPKAKTNPSFTIGMKRENAKRNRTPNVLPYDDNSIRLTPSKQNIDGYINASPISTQVGERVWNYIVGQIPLCGSGPCALWQMIWETGTKIMVSLERDSSAPFYPTENSPTLTFGDFQVTDSKKQRATDQAPIARELILNLVSKKKQRRVWLLPYEDEWKHDVPVDTEHFLCFLEEVNSVQRKVNEGVKLEPLTVLCATGAGRSGVFVLSDILLHTADSGHKIHCNRLLSGLRTERMLLVTHPQQYAFVLDTLAKYLAQSRLI